MAARLTYIECSGGSSLAVCVCGYRAVRASRQAATRALDEHRAQAHRKAATDVESARRRRTRVRS